MSETTLKVAVLRFLKSDGWFTFKLSDKFTSGIPDIVAMKDGRTIWLELKTKEGRVSPIQEWTIKEILRAGCEAHICRSLTDVKEAVKWHQSL